MPVGADHKKTARSGNQVSCAAASPAEVERARAYLRDKHRDSADVGAAASLEPIPQWCLDNAFNGIAFNRTQVCEIGAWTSTITSPNGVVLATLTYVATTYTYTFADSNIWGEQMELELISGTGIVKGTTVDGDADCGPPVPEQRCDIASLDFPEQKFEVGSRAAGSAFYESVDLASGDVRSEESRLFAYFHNPEWEAQGADGFGLIWLSFPRCDNALPGYPIGGCVFSQYTWSTMTYRLDGPYPELALHIAAAQASGLPGAFIDGPNPTPLERVTNDTLIALNRDAACNIPAYPRPPGKDCDEYPFASTAQGAFLGGGAARTFDWCQIDEPEGEGPVGYSVCMIDSGQNQRGGSDLNTVLFLPFRIIDGDPFHVNVE
ncbi:hypothetical protein [Flindersiella endophytica]